MYLCTYIYTWQKRDLKKYLIIANSTTPMAAWMCYTLFHLFDRKWLWRGEPSIFQSLAAINLRRQRKKKRRARADTRLNTPAIKRRGLKLAKQMVWHVFQKRCDQFWNFDLGKLRLLKRLIFRSTCLNSARIATWSMALAWPLQRKIPSINSCTRTHNRSTHSAFPFLRQSPVSSRQPVQENQCHWNNTRPAMHTWHTARIASKQSAVR